MPRYWFAIEASVEVEAEDAEAAAKQLGTKLAADYSLALREARFAALAVVEQGLPMRPLRFVEGSTDPIVVTRPTEMAAWPRQGIGAESDQPCLSPQDLLRFVAAQADAERAYKLATAMLAAKTTETFDAVFRHAIDILHGATASDRDRIGARTVIDTLTNLLLTRVRVMDEEFQKLLDRLAEKEFGYGVEDPPHYDRDEGLSWFLQPEHDDPDDQRDVALDLFAEPGRVVLSMRVVDEAGPRVTGSVDVDELATFRCFLEIVALDAESLAEGDGEEG